MFCVHFFGQTKTMTVLLMVSLAQTKHQCHHVPALIILKGARGKQVVAQSCSSSIFHRSHHCRFELQYCVKVSNHEEFSVGKYIGGAVFIPKSSQAEILCRSKCHKRTENIVDGILFLCPVIFSDCSLKSKLSKRGEIGFNLPFLESCEDVEGEQGEECDCSRWVVRDSLSYWFLILRFFSCKSQTGF